MKQSQGIIHLQAHRLIAHTFINPVGQGDKLMGPDLAARCRPHRQIVDGCRRRIDPVGRLGLADHQPAIKRRAVAADDADKGTVVPDRRTGTHRALAWVPGCKAALPIVGSKVSATAFAACGSADSQLWKAKADDQGIPAARGRRKSAQKAMRRARLVARKKYCSGITTATTARAMRFQSSNSISPLAMVAKVGTLGLPPITAMMPMRITTMTTQMARKAPTASMKLEVRAASPNTGRLKYSSR